MVKHMNHSIIIDMGMCLRVPYARADGGVTDVTHGTLRRLIKRQTPCGKLNYMSPEIMKSQDFDGYYIDLWGAGVILFIMLVGCVPFEMATEEDVRFRQISRGGLEQLLHCWGKSVSPEATDLLQKMLLANPRQRPSLSEIQDHPWILGEVPTVEMSSPAPMDEGWRF